MKYRFLFTVLIALPLTLGVACSEDPKPTAPVAEAPHSNGGELTPQEIASLYKDSVVEINVTLTREDGFMEGWLGSGFFIDSNGTILTAGHVAWDDKTEAAGMFGVTTVSSVKEYRYWVTLNNRKYEAKLVSVNKYKDVAIIRIADVDPKTYQPAKLGDSEKMKVGDPVYAYGSAEGLTSTFTSGKVSAMHRYIDLNWVEDYIQTDAPINPGNSGGPLINSHGEVIGINDAGVRGADGLGFAVAINFADVPKLLISGIVEAGYLGSDVLLDNFPRSGAAGDPGWEDLDTLHRLTGFDSVSSLTLLANLTYPTADKSEDHAVVLSVDMKSPAAVAGLERGDLITSFNGKAVKSGRDVRLLTLDIQPGTEFEVKVLRIQKGAMKELTLKIALLKEKPKN